MNVNTKSHVHDSLTTHESRLTILIRHYGIHIHCVFTSSRDVVETIYPSIDSFNQNEDGTHEDKIIPSKPQASYGVGDLL